MHLPAEKWVDELVILSVLCRPHVKLTDAHGEL